MLEALKASEAKEVKEAVETAVASDLDIHTELVRDNIILHYYSNTILT